MLDKKRKGGRKKDIVILQWIRTKDKRVLDLRTGSGSGYVFDLLKKEIPDVDTKLVSCKSAGQPTF